MKSLGFLFLIMLISLTALGQNNTELIEQVNELNKKGHEEVKSNNFQKAIELFTQSINKKPTAQAYLSRGECRKNLGDYAAAIDDYNSGLAIFSEFLGNDDQLRSWILYAMGYCKRKLRRYNEAVSDFTKAISYGYEDSLVYMDRGDCYFNQRLYPEADEDYRKAIDRVSGYGKLYTLWFTRGEGKRLSNKDKEADSFYTRALFYGPNNYAGYWNRGVCREKLYQQAAKMDEMFGGGGHVDYFDETLSDFDKAIGIINTEAGKNKSDTATTYKFYYYLVLLYGKKASLYGNVNRYDDAITALNSLISAGNSAGNKADVISQLAWAHQFRGNIYKELKNYQKAGVDYRKAITLQRDSAARTDMVIVLVNMEKELLDYKSCLEDLNRQIALEPRNGSYYYHRSQVYGYRKNYAQAIRDADESVRLFKNDSSNRAYSLWVRAKHKDNLGDFKGAAEDLLAYLELYPGNYSIYYLLGRLYKQKIKNNELAATNLSKAATMAMEASDTIEYCYIKMINGNKEEALELMHRVLEGAPEPGTYYAKWNPYNLCCLYALSGNETKAMEWLERSLKAGYDDYNHLVNDNDLLPLMKLPQWKVILAKYKVPVIKP